MKKLLAVVRRVDGGFRGYVPKLPGCEIRAATAEQAEADISAAASAHIAAGKQGVGGFSPDQVEIAVAVEPEVPEKYRCDGVEAAFMRRQFELPDDDMLEALLNPEEHEWLSFEDVERELGLEQGKAPTDGPAE